jgi:hypothetical protein
MPDSIRPSTNLNPPPGVLRRRLAVAQREAGILRRLGRSAAHVLRHAFPAGAVTASGRQGVSRAD